MADPGRAAAGSRGALGLRTLSPGEILRAGGAPTVPFLLGPDGRPLPQEVFRSPIDYGPGTPLPPRIPQPGYEPRGGIYPLGYNLSLTPRQEYSGNLSFDTLRTLSDLCTYARIAIEYRKKKIRGRRLEFVGKDDPKSRSLRTKLKDQIDAANYFWWMPNRIDGTGYSPWIGQLVEEMMVTDATVFFKHRRVDGGLHSLVQIDGSTIKPLIDQFAHVVGYEQIIWGLPATAYDLDRELDVDLDDGPIAYDKSDLAYLIYNPRVDNIYGTSPLEEIKPIVDIAIRRSIAQLAYYTDGNIPQGFIEAPEGFSNTQIAALETYLVENFSGDIPKNAQLRVVPHGANYKPTQPFNFTKDEEEAMASQILAFYAVPKNILVSQVNRATAENQSNEAEDAGDAPLSEFLLEFINGVTQGDLGLSDVKAVFTNGRSQTSKSEAESLVSLANAGILTKNEARGELGLDPLSDEELAAAAPPKPAFPGQPGQPAGDAEETVQGEDEPAADEKPADEDAEKAELATYRRWAIKRVGRGRAGEAFETKAIPRRLATRIQAALGAARSEADVAEVFDLAKAKRVTATRTRTDEKAITAALTDYFDREYGRADEVGGKRLKENAA